MTIPTDHKHPEPEHEPTPLGKPKAASPAPREEPPTAPVISALLPPSAAVGDPTFMLHVIGARFSPASVLVFAGQDEPTTFLADTELATMVNMDVWLGPDPALSVQVRNADGQVSNTLSFVMQPPRAVPVDEAAASQPYPKVDLVRPL